MTTKKHLVLDYDVHLRLQRRKKQLGLSIKAIGNAILRICLDKSPSMFALLGDELIGMGRITPDEYNAAIERTLKRAAQIYAADDVFLLSAGEGSVPYGSWELKCLYGPEDDGTRVFSLQTRDKRGLMTPVHCHREDLHALVLSGKVVFQVGADQHVVGANSGIHVPAGQVHATSPLSSSARMLIALVDPESSEVPMTAQVSETSG